MSWVLPAIRLLAVALRTVTMTSLTRWEHEHVVDVVQRRLDENPKAMRQRRETAEHPFATLKMRMDALLDEAPAEGGHRDGPTRARLQPYTGHEHHRNPSADRGHRRAALTTKPCPGSVATGNPPGKAINSGGIPAS
jgi:hypothetical protein